MRVISITFFQVMGVCLALYTSATFASPVAIDFTPKPRGGLERRVKLEPPVSICPDGTTWVRRQCVPERGPWAWQDVCTGPTARGSSCLPTEECVKVTDKDNDKHIKCEPILKSNTVRGATRIDNSQVGTSEVKYGMDQFAPTPLEWDVPIHDNLGLCSVFASVLSSDGTWVLQTVYIIIGRVNRDQVACTGEPSDSSESRECSPQGTVNLKAGDTLNFTWGLTSGQAAVLHYAIIPV